MKWVLVLLAVCWVAAGCCYILYTESSRQLIRRLLAQMNTKLLAAVPAVFGVLLIAAASSSKYSAVIVFIGLIAIAKAVLIYMNPAGLYDRAKAWVLEGASDQTLRLMGILALILGTSVLSWIR